MIYFLLKFSVQFLFIAIIIVFAIFWNRAIELLDKKLFSKYHLIVKQMTTIVFVILAETSFIWFISDQINWVFVDSYVIFSIMIFGFAWYISMMRVRNENNAAAWNRFAGGMSETSDIKVFRFQFTPVSIGALISCLLSLLLFFLYYFNYFFS